MDEIVLLSEFSLADIYYETRELKSSVSEDESEDTNKKFANIWKLEFPIYSYCCWKDISEINPTYSTLYKNLAKPNEKSLVINLTKKPNEYLLEPLVYVILRTNSKDGSNKVLEYDITNDIEIDYERTIEENNNINSEEDLNSYIEMVSQKDGKYFKYKRPCSINVILKIPAKEENKNSFNDFIKTDNTYFKLELNITKANSYFTGFTQLCYHTIPYIKTVEELKLEDIVSNNDFCYGYSFQTRSTGQFTQTKIVDIHTDKLDIKNIDKQKIYYIHGTQNGDEFYEDLENKIIPIKFV